MTVFLVSFLLSLTAAAFAYWLGRRSRPEPEPEPDELEIEYGRGDFVRHKLGLFDRGVACSFDPSDATVQVAFTGHGAYAKIWVSVFKVELLVETSELLDPKRRGN